VILNLQQTATPPVASPFNPQDPESYNDSTSTRVCDLRGDSYPLTFYFANTASPGVWDVYATINGVLVSANPTATTLTFASTGQLKAPKSGNLSFAYAPTNGVAPLAVTFNFSGTTSFNGPFSVTSITHNGCK
jgi:flagellar hook protein FlgE